MTSRSRSVNRFAVVRFVRPVLLALCPVSCVFQHVTLPYQSTYQPRVLLLFSHHRHTSSRYGCAARSSCSRYMPALRFAFRGWIFRVVLRLWHRLAQCPVIPLRPEENITAAIDGNDVIHHKSWRIKSP